MSNMNIILLTMATSAGTLVCVLVKGSAKSVLFVLLGAWTCLAFAAFIINISGKGKGLGQSGNFANTFYGEVPRTVTKEDHEFLDNLVQQQNRDGQNIAKTERDSKPVPRAELIVNTSKVKRAQLVVNSRIVERADLLRPRGQ